MLVSRSIRSLNWLLTVSVKSRTSKRSLEVTVFSPQPQSNLIRQTAQSNRLLSQIRHHWHRCGKGWRCWEKDLTQEGGGLGCSCPNCSRRLWCAEKRAGQAHPIWNARNAHLPRRIPRLGRLWLWGWRQGASLAYWLRIHVRQLRWWWRQRP